MNPKSVSRRTASVPYPRSTWSAPMSTASVAARVGNDAPYSVTWPTSTSVSRSTTLNPTLPGLVLVDQPRYISTTAFRCV